MGATMKDIARETGLGLATISSYLNGGNVREKNRIKIEEAIEKLHFEVNEVARGLKTNRTKTIGIILPELNNIFFSEIITAAEDLLRSHGYATMICDCRSDVKREEEAAEFLLHRRVDGLIMMPTGAEKKVFDRFRKSGRPVVLIDRRMENGDCDCVLVDNEGAAQNAVKRLMKKGHKKIGMITGPDNVYTARERQRGYELAIQESSKARSAQQSDLKGKTRSSSGARETRPETAPISNAATTGSKPSIRRAPCSTNRPLTTRTITPTSSARCTGATSSVRNTSPKIPRNR